MQQTCIEGVQDQTRLGGKLIHWELCKRLKLDYTCKWNQFKKMWRIKFSGILRCRPNFNQKKICRLVEFIVQSDQRNQRKWKDKQILGPCQRTEKAVEHKGQVSINCCLCTRNVVYQSHNDINPNNNTIHIQTLADSFVSDTNTFINFWLQSMATRGERHNS